MSIQNLEKLDKIQLTKEQIKKLMEWKENNKDIVRQFKPVIQEGLLSTDVTFLHFQDDGEVIEYSYMDNITLEVIVKLTYFRESMTVNNVAYVKNGKCEHVKQYAKHFQESHHNAMKLIQDIITVHASTMAYMQYYKKDVITEQKEVKLTRKEQERVNRATRNNNTITIKTHKTIYKLPETNNIKTRELTKRQIIAEAWTVRGHTRRLENGKEIFIKPYVKGRNKENIKGREYKIEF